MARNNDIEQVSEVDPISDVDGKDDFTETGQVDTEHPQKATGAKYDSHEESYTIKTFWKDKPLGRTLSLRNKTGKIGATILGGAASTFIPGPIGNWINKGFDALITTQTMTGMEFLDMSFLQMAIVAGVALITWALPSLVPAVKKKTAWKVVRSRLDGVADEVVQAIDEDSEKGKKISRNELKDIIGDVLKKEE